MGKSKIMISVSIVFVIGLMLGIAGCGKLNNSNDNVPSIRIVAKSISNNQVNISVECESIVGDHLMISKTYDNLNYALVGTYEIIDKSIEDLTFSRGWSIAKYSAHIITTEGINTEYYSDWVEAPITSIWDITTIESYAEYGSKIAMALDKDNYAHVLYVANGSLTYATNRSGNWVKQENIVSASAPNNISIVVDKQNKAHACFIGNVVIDSAGGYNTKLYYLTNSTNDSVWNSTIIDGADTCSIVVDSNNRPRIIYASSSDLKCASEDTGGWATAYVIKPPVLTQHIDVYSVAIDPNNKIHCVFRIMDHKGTSDPIDDVTSLNYANNVYSEWQLTTLETMAGWGAYDIYGNSDYFVYESSIVSDVDGHIHGVFQGLGPKLRYFDNVYGNWAFYTIDNVGAVGAFPSISTDNADNVYITYREYLGGGLKLISDKSGGWQIESITNIDCLDNIIHGNRAPCINRVGTDGSLYVAYIQAGKQYAEYLSSPTYKIAKKHF